MDRINGAGTVDIGGGRRGFRDEDLAVGQEGTEVTALWLTMIQEEVLKLIEATGGDPSESDWSQLASAIQSGKLNFAVAAGTANALTLALALPLVAYTAGLTLLVRLVASNTAAMTINVDGCGAVALLRSDGLPMAPGDASNGVLLPIRYDGAAFRAGVPVASQIKSGAMAPVTTQTFSALGSQTWVVPAGVTSIMVRLWGGGGGGGYANGFNSSAPSGGGSGAYAERKFSVTPGDSVTIVVGAGGVGGSASPARQGQPGLASQVTVGGVTVTAGGGGGGLNTTGSNALANSSPGGVASGGDFSLSGEAGHIGVVIGSGAIASGGSGAAAPLGGGQIPGGRGGSANGSVPGGGGSATSDFNFAGGTGARGEVQIIY